MRVNESFHRLRGTRPKVARKPPTVRVRRIAFGWEAEVRDGKQLIHLTAFFGTPVEAREAAEQWTAGMHDGVPSRTGVTT